MGLFSTIFGTRKKVQWWQRRTGLTNSMIKRTSREVFKRYKRNRRTKGCL